MTRPPPPKSRDNPSPNDARYNGWTELVEMAEGTDCQRLVMSGWTDGPALRVSCTSGDYALCGNCLELRERAQADPIAFVAASQRQFDFDKHAMPRRVYTRTDIVEHQIPWSTNVEHAPGRDIIESHPADGARMSTPNVISIDSPPNSPPAKRAKYTAMDVDDDDITSYSSPPRPVPGPSTRPMLPRTNVARAIDQRNRAHAVGPLVKLNSSHARATSAASRSASYAPEPGSNMDMILRMKAKFSHRCMICFIDQGIDRCSGHTVRTCPPGVHKGYGLPMHEIDGWTLESAKSSRKMKLPGKAGICFYCLWPDHTHTSDAEKPDCDGGDVIQPLCWLIFRHEDYRWKMIQAFNLAPEISIENFWVWLGKVDPEEKLHGPHPVYPTCPFINAHKVALWFVFPFSKILPKKESVEWYRTHRPQNSLLAGSRL
ncbi:hypothetical protein FS749_002534 [Ceratobasidium sp. UAMH 11750]|nr:hypothetical protein FS749_002534 [Ceratobasidium sp. UAMH 11750]